MKPFILSLLVAVALTACTNYGKKVKIEGTKGEVYYKGEGVTETDARNTGEFLNKEGYFSSGKGASIQIAKEGEEYTLRFVYNKSVYDTIKNADDIFKIIGARASKAVFGGKKVNIALANKSFKDYKTIPYDEAVAKSLEAPPPATDNLVFSRDDFDHDAAGGVDFYWTKDIPDDESKTIADYIVKNGAFAGGSSEIYMTKEDGRYVLRFPMKESARTDPSILAEVEKVSKEIKDNLFANVPYSFKGTDLQLQTVKSWDY
jgi:hypothetical protein